MAKKLFISQLKPVLRLCYKKKELFLLSMFFDLCFFTALLVIHYFVLVAVKEHVFKFMDMMQETVGGIANAETVSQVSPELLMTPELTAVYHAIAKYFIILLLGILLSWLVFKGINWYIANRMIRKVNTQKFALKFIGYTIIAAVCLVILFAITIKLISYSTFAFLPLIGVFADRIIFFLLVWVLAYFVFIAYSLIPETDCRKLCRFAVKNYRKIVPAHLLLLVVLSFITFITIWSINVNYWAPFILGLLVLLPAFTYGRIYIVVIVNKVLKRG